jgi:hypothetical protein
MLKEKLMSQEPLDSNYKYELYILSDILDIPIDVVNQYDETILEFKGGSKEGITIKYDVYNDVITKFYAIYSII